MTRVAQVLLGLHTYLAIYSLLVIWHEFSNGFLFGVRISKTYYDFIALYTLESFRMGIFFLLPVVLLLVTMVYLPAMMFSKEVRFVKGMAFLFASVLINTLSFWFYFATHVPRV